jgi:hypothetical protein
MATKVYYQRDFDKIIHDGVSFSIPGDVLQRIMDLEAKMKIKAAATTNSYEARSNQRGPAKVQGRGSTRPPRRQEDATSDSWERENDKAAPPTGLKKKPPAESKDAIVQRILICLNKISKGNFDTQLAEIRTALKELLQVDPEQEAVKAALAEVLSVCTRTQGMVPLYADLWFFIATEPIELTDPSDPGAKPLYLPCREVFEQRLDLFQASFSDIAYVDPEKDNDGFCAYTKKNTQRRAMTVFLTALQQKGLVCWETYLDCVEFMVGKVVGWVANVAENRRNELEEVSENLFLTLSANCAATCSEEEEADRWNRVWEQVATLSQTVVRDFPNMTSRSKFKYQDLVKYWNLRFQ